MSLQIDPTTVAFTADQRLVEIARILAGAVLRLRDRGALPGPRKGEQIPPKSVSNCLELSAPPRLSVSHTS
jgi:hypothetical protein